MKRKQIYLEENMIKKIKKLAAKRDTTQSELIRHALSEYIKKQQLKGEVNDPLLELIGMVDIQQEDSSENHDQYIYGVKKDSE